MKFSINKKTEKIVIIFAVLSLLVISLAFFYHKIFNVYKEDQYQSIGYKAVLVSEAFQTEYNKKDNIDSLAVWHGKDNQNWLLATAKSTNKIIVYDVQNGKELKRIGVSGKEKGKFDRPNGIAVIDDFAFITERDNPRVQVFSLPDFKFLSSIGEDRLKRPYGVALYKTKPNKYIMYVTDDYKVDKNSYLDERIKRYKVKYKEDKIDNKFLNAFGQDKLLKKVESLLIDKENNRLFIADEDSSEKNIKIFALDGKFEGKILGESLFEREPEGIALYRIGKDNGYVIATDQRYERSIFHVFDRKTLSHLGAFKGKVTSNTDGVALDQKPFNRFDKGVFFAVDNDGGVSAFSLERIFLELKLS